MASGAERSARPAPTPAAETGPTELADTIGQVLAEQRERTERLRNVQDFLSAPVFLDLKEMGLDIALSDPPEAIEERRRDLDYRITVLESVLGLLRDERRALAVLTGEEAPSAQAAPDCEDGVSEDGAGNEGGDDGSG